MKNILITGGPTNEYIDEVMKITNMSTGSLSTNMGMRFLEAGYSVTLVLNRSVNTEKLLNMEQSSNLEIIPVETTADMLEAIEEGIQNRLDIPLRGAMLNELMTSPYTLDRVGEHKMAPEEFVWQPAYGKWPYLYNIANRSAEHFYKEHGLKKIGRAFELAQPSGEALIMQCRHCIRYSLGYCVKRGGLKPQWQEPLFLELGDGRRFRLGFNCAECQMDVYGSK